METRTVHWGHIRGYRDYIGQYRDDGKENGNYYSMLGLYWDNGDYIGFILGLRNMMGFRV